MDRLVIMITLLFALPAGATTMLPLDLHALTNRADRVVVGTVEKVQPSWTVDHSAIYTDVTLKVDHAVKGALNPGERVVVRHEGGSVDGIGMRVFGSAQFAVGEEVMVFLERRSGASFVVGMAQGKLTVVTPTDGKRRVMASHRGIDFVGTPAAPASLSGRTLEEVEAEVRSYSPTQRTK